MTNIVGVAACAVTIQPSIIADSIAHLIVDRKERMAFEPMNKTTNGTVLAAEHVSMEVSSPEGSLTILDDVNVFIQSGETVAIVGASGAGKSTLLALLAGLDVPTTGTIKLKDIELTTLDEMDVLPCARSTLVLCSRVSILFLHSRRWKISCCHLSLLANPMRGSRQ